MTLARARGTKKKSVVVLGDEIARGQVKDQATIHLPVKVEIKIIESRESRLACAVVPAIDRRDE